LAIKFRITIEEGFGAIQKLLVVGFEKAGFSDVSLFLCHSRGAGFDHFITSSSGGDRH
jgi:hypothetical protein